VSKYKFVVNKHTNLYNQRILKTKMKGKLIATTAASIVVGLTSSNCGVGSDSSGLPVFNPDFGRTYSLYEGDIQGDPDQALTTSFTVPFPCDNIGVNVRAIEQEGRSPPFDATFMGSTDPSGETTEVVVNLTDNDNPYHEGSTWNLEIDGISRHPHVRDVKHVVHIDYHSGNSGGVVQGQLDVLRDRIGELEGLITPPGPGPAPGPTPDNGVCEAGEDWRTEYACPIPTDVFSDPSHVKMELYIDGQLVQAPITMPQGSFVGGEARLTTSSELEAAFVDRGITVPDAVVKDQGYNEDSPTYDPANPNCFYVANVTTTAANPALTTPTSKVRSTYFDLVQSGAPCPQTTEVLGAWHDFSSQLGTGYIAAASEDATAL